MYQNSTIYIDFQGLDDKQMGAQTYKEESK
jgi:hypothetical protein